MAKKRDKGKCANINSALAVLLQYFCLPKDVLYMTGRRYLGKSQIDYDNGVETS